MLLNKVMHVFAKILFNITAVLFGLTLMFTILCEDSQVEDMISEYVFKDTGTTITVNTGKTPIYYKTWYSSVEDVLDGNGAVAAAAQAEGTVLLKNENSALPLAAGEKVSLYGVTAYDPMYSLDGAGEIIVNASRQQYFYDEFEAAGLTMNSSLANWYKVDGTQFKRGKTTSNGVNVDINGETWEDIPASAKNRGTFGQDSTAIFIVGRMTNEAIDLPPLPSGSGTAGLTDNDYLQFTTREENMIENLCNSYDKVIVLFNQANPMQEDLPEVLKNVEGVMWIGFPGSDGIKAVADLLVGKSNPSGGLSDMWYSYADANPSMPNYGLSNNVVMAEGMYLGYRYAETRYEDLLLASDNAGTYDYSSAVSYPFGYGLSYTDFSYTIEEVIADPDPAKNHLENDPEKDLRPADQLRATGDDLGDCDDIIVRVRVRNTGSVAGKKNIQIYLQQPITATDKANGVEKPSVELVGFGKTSKLEANGGEEVIDIKIDANKLFAAYDRLANDGKGSYVLSEGTYYLVAASNSHEAVNSILKAKDSGIQGIDAEFGAGDASLVYKVNVDSARSQSYVYWTQGAEQPENLFDASDPNVAFNDPDRVTYMSRYNWKDTGVSANYDNMSTSGIREEFATGVLDNNNNLNTANVNLYYPEIDTSVSDPVFAAQSVDPADENTIALVEMRGIEYDPNRGATEEDIAKWEQFMSQLTWEETVTTVAYGRRQTEAISSVSKPYTYDVNASNGISWKFNMSGERGIGFGMHFDAANTDYTPTGYPCEGIIASTFNVELAYAVGQAIGEDGLWSGASGLYGFGLGLHRNPYHGRTGEFYSEDPVLTGYIAGYETAGAQSKGLYVYNKHFVLNDQETNRTGYKAWLNEQTMRQIYLRPFEIAIEIGDAMNVMNSFNKIGMTWTGNYYNLMTGWLRGEAGMAGFAVTDWYRSGGMNMVYGMLAGTDLPDGSDYSNIVQYAPGSGYGYYTTAVRQAAQRIMYTVANSNAMNFYGEDTLVYSFDPDWYEWRDIAVTAVIGAFAVSAVLVYATSVAKFTNYVSSRRGKNLNKD